MAKQKSNKKVFTTLLTIETIEKLTSIVEETGASKTFVVEKALQELFSKLEEEENQIGV